MAKKAAPKTGTPETAAEKFTRLASLRTNKALKAVALIGNLSGSGYSYTPEQVTKIVTALKAELANVEARFRGQGTKATFTL